MGEAGILDLAGDGAGQLVGQFLKFAGQWFAFLKTHLRCFGMPCPSRPLTQGHDGYANLSRREADVAGVGREGGQRRSAFVVGIAPPGHFMISARLTR